MRITPPASRSPRRPRRRRWRRGIRGSSRAPRGLAADYANGNPRVDPPVPPGSWFVLSESLPNNPGTGTLFNDGYYATYRTHRDRTLWYRAGAPEDRDEEQGALDPGAGRTEPPPEQQDVNVFYRKGGIEFWYKPDFDWSYGPPGAEKPTPLACGYVFASRVWYNHGRPDYYPSGAAAIQPPTPSDGTQLFVFRNTEGQLRATRLYFRVVGDPEAPSGEVPARFHDPIPNDPYGDGAWFTAGPLVHPPPSAPPGKIFGAIERYREAAERDPVDDPTKRSPPDGYVWPPAEFQVLDEGIKRARTDAFVQFDHMKHWKAHEWHHIAVYWDDGATDKERALRIYVDGVKRSVAHGLPVDIAADKHMFVRLNEPPNMNRPGQARYPKDHLFIAGVQRNLAKTGVGVFKHTNTVFNETAPGQALPSGIDPNRVTLFACGTVDDVIVYDGTTSPPDSLSLSRLRRFQPSADYVNHFDLRAAFPRSGEPLTLARLSWTALLPTRYGNALSPDGEGAVEVKVVSEPPGVLMNRPETAGTTTSVRYDDMREYSHVNLVDANGRPAQLWPPNNPAGPWPRIRYELRLHAASFPSSAGAGVLAAIDTPVVQEVALSWFLPAPEVMLKERLVD
ncbi:MAG: hypothetical protein KatS3mg102_1913 [Planctomycetota bacterium]|nr:MAG: hypothetical protein KatS3mg102_1913 [Planctomycetota bacterium]